MIRFNSNIYLRTGCVGGGESLFSPPGEEGWESGGDGEEMAAEDAVFVVVVVVPESEDLVSHDGGERPRYRSRQASCMNCIRVCLRHLARRFWNQTCTHAEHIG